MTDNNTITQNGAGVNNDRPRNRRIIILFIFFLLIAIVGAAILISHDHHNGSNFPTSDQEHNTVFQGMDSFIKSGLTTNQVNVLIKDFSKFSPSAKTISVDPNSLIPGPHDPNRDVSFTLNFNATIDSSSYKGTVLYSGLGAARLVLFSKDGKQVYDSK